MGAGHWSAIIALVFAIGCSGEPLDPAFEVGFVIEGEFVALEDGHTCPVVDAVQGGYWVMPFMRSQGVDSTLIVNCTVVDLTRNLELADIEVERTFRPVDDDWKEHRLLLNLDEVQTPADFDALDGNDGRLSCSIIDDSVSLAYERLITLETVRPFPP